MFARLAKSILKRTVSPALDGAGFYDRHLERLNGAHWLIVMYHRVIVDPTLDPFALGMCVSKQHFDEQIGFLRKTFHPIGMSQAVALLEQGRPLPERCVSVTLDDGYLDNLVHALPVLEKHAMPATLFVPTGGLDDDAPLWWDRAIHALAMTKRSTVAADLLGLTAPTTLPLSFWQRARTVEIILDALWERPLAQTLSTVAALERELLPAGCPGSAAKRMNAKQILEMQHHGVEIAAHTVRHPNLTLEPESQVRWELETSKASLEALCGTSIKGFAYPAGWLNDQTVNLAREAGFRYAVATSTGFSAPQRDIFKLDRVGMPDSSPADFKRALVNIARRGHAFGPKGATALPAP